MVFSRWFQGQLDKNKDWKKMNNRLNQLEKNVEIMQLKVDEIGKKIHNKKEEKEIKWVGSPTIIEYLNVEKIDVDRYEQSNNFGALGIKSLEGRLNIGANYGSPEQLPIELQKSIKKELEKNHKNKPEKIKPSKTKMSPKTTIRARSGDTSSLMD